MKPETVIRWHRAGYRLFWKWKSRKRAGRPSVDPNTLALIRRMARENPTWGGARIHGELTRLGVPVSEASVHRHLSNRPPAPGRAQSWKTFLDNHREVLAAMDFITVPTWNFRSLYALVILAHGRRAIIHVNVTAHPTADWVKQLLREAFPFGEIPVTCPRELGPGRMSLPQSEGGRCASEAVFRGTDHPGLETA